RTRRGQAHAGRCLRPPAYRRGGTGRRALADHGQPRRPRHPGPGRRPGDPHRTTPRLHHLPCVRPIVRRMTPVPLLPVLLLATALSVGLLSGCDSPAPARSGGSGAPPDTSTHGSPASTGPAPSGGPTGTPHV